MLVVGVGVVAVGVDGATNCWCVPGVIPGVVGVTAVLRVVLVVLLLVIRRLPWLFS